jgi:hypothetical protein
MESNNEDVRSQLQKICDELRKPIHSEEVAKALDERDPLASFREKV